MSALFERLRIERSGIPIYLQIRDQMLQAIGMGIVKPGERMPTMRQVAVAARVDLNTVRHAYEALAKTGAIVILPARGTFVSEEPPRADPAAEAWRIEELAQRTIAAARTSGLDPVEVANRVLALSKELAMPQGKDASHE